MALNVDTGNVHNRIEVMSLQRKDGQEMRKEEDEEKQTHLAGRGYDISNHCLDKTLKHIVYYSR